LTELCSSFVLKISQFVIGTAATLLLLLENTFEIELAPAPIWPNGGFVDVFRLVLKLLRAVDIRINLRKNAGIRMLIRSISFQSRVLFLCFISAGISLAFCFTGF